MRSRSSLISRLMLRMPRPSSFPPPDTSARPRTTSPASVAMGAGKEDRKSTRLNSSHVEISYAVFCLKKKKNNQTRYRPSNEELITVLNGIKDNIKEIGAQIVFDNGRYLFYLNSTVDYLLALHITVND